MRDYAPGVGWWAFTQTSAADQARLLFMLGALIPRTLLRLRALADVDDRAVTELGDPAGRTAALAGLLQDRPAPRRGTVQRGRRAWSAGASRSRSRSSPTATRRWPTGSKPSKASPRGCSRTRHEPTRRERDRRVERPADRARGEGDFSSCTTGEGPTRATCCRWPTFSTRHAELHVVPPRAPLALDGSPRLSLVSGPARRLPRPRDLRGGLRALAALHDELWQRTGIGPGRTVLGGFSMGCVMSYALGLGARAPARPQGSSPSRASCPRSRAGARSRRTRRACRCSSPTARATR